MGTRDPFPWKSRQHTPASTTWLYLVWICCINNKKISVASDHIRNRTQGNASGQNDQLGLERGGAYRAREAYAETEPHPTQHLTLR